MANPDVSRAFPFPWRPWPPGDPGPEIWQIINELDQRVQLQVATAVMNTQIAMAKAHLEGLQSIQKIVANAQVG
jgi:hypothetical protein